MSSDPTWIRGAARRPRYIGSGRPTALYRYLADLQGARSLAERVALATVGRLGRPLPVRDATILEAWGRLRQVFPEFESALLIYTGYYKNIVLSGVVDSGGLHFVKIFVDPEDHEAERRRLNDLRGIAPGESCWLA